MSYAKAIALQLVASSLLSMQQNKSSAQTGMSVCIQLMTVQSAMLLPMAQTCIHCRQSHCRFDIPALTLHAHCLVPYQTITVA